MSILGKIFKKEKIEENKKGTEAALEIKEIVALTHDSVKVIFDVPEELKEKYDYLPGQYLNVVVPINGEEVHRSYSICSMTDEPLAIGVKKIKDGLVSGYFNNTEHVGEKIEVSFPLGHFTLPKEDGKYIAFVGGSGITPVLSIAKQVNARNNSNLHLFYGNRDDQSIMFKDELETLAEEKVKITHVFSEKEKEGVHFGMLTEETITALIKEDLSVLKADGFYLCGPEPVIVNAQNALKKFGVADEKLHYELFTTPELLKSTKIEPAVHFEGISKVKVILDDEEEEFELKSNGSTILEECESNGIDPPYSCRGAICCTCRAKVLKGSVTMDKNFTLTDKEIEEGYVLTCQSHPNSEEVIISYDE